jgi:hypothetical protein
MSKMRISNTITERVGFGQPESDQPLLDTTTYGAGHDDRLGPAQAVGRMITLSSGHARPAMKSTSDAAGLRFRWLN